MKKCVVIALFLAALGTSSAQTPPLDHFKCYFVPQATPQVNPVVTLQDQFDIANQQTETVEVLRTARFCNPVAKLHGRAFTPISNPDHHLTLYLFNPQPKVTRDALVRNQFGVQKLALADPRVLAVPSQKLTPVPHPAPQGLDHFKCYAASGRRIQRIVTLRDQFHTERVKVLDPVAFCNPVRKTDASGVSTPVLNAKDHLTCYTITRRPFTGAVDASNQFGTQFLLLSSADILCVPSGKLRWAEVAAPADTEPDR